MPDPNEDDLLKAVRKPLVLSIDLIGYELPHPSDRLSLALNEPSVQWKIQEAIDKEAFRLIQPSFGTFYATGDPAKRIALSTLQIAGEATWASVQKSPRYKLLDSSLNDLKTSFDKTPTGIFVNQHVPELILAGSLLTIGGAVAQYHFRTNADLAALYAFGVSAATSKIKIGDLTLGATLPKFVTAPKRELEFKSYGQYDFKVLETKLEFDGRVQNDKLNSLDARAMITVPLHYGDMAFKLKGGFGPSFSHMGDGSPMDTKWNYLLGVDAESKDSRLKAGLLFSGGNQPPTLTGALKYMF